MALTTVVVKWSGPFSIEAVRETGKGNGIYILTGKLERQRKERIQYCGITERTFYKRLRGRRHKRSELRELSVWLGEILYPTTFDRSILEIAESCFVSFWQPPMNKRKKVYCPKRGICLISQWLNPEEEPRRVRPEIIQDLPDILWWDEERWRTGQLNVGKAL